MTTQNLKRKKNNCIKDQKTTRSYRGSAIVKPFSAKWTGEQTEELFKDSQKILTTILDSVDADIYIADLENYNILFMNKHMKDSFGHDLVGKICWKAFRGNSGPCDHCTNRKLLDPEGHPTGVIVWETKNPITEHWYSNYDRAIRWVDGRLVQLQIATDITERKRIETALQESEERYRILVNNMQDGVYLFDKNGYFTFVNPIMEKRSGFSAEKFKTLHYLDILPPEYHKKALNNFERSLRGEQGPPFEMSYRTANGAQLYMEVNTTPLVEEGKVVAVLGISHNFTERIESEEALRKSEERYRTILENIEDGYYEVDIAGNLTFCNDSFSRLFGYSKDEMIGMNNRHYTDEENGNKLYQAFNKVYRTRQPTQAFDLSVTRKDGRKIFGEVSVSLLTDIKGQPIGFRGIAHDITERKQTERALRESEEKYRSILENIEDGYFEVDLPGNLTFFNDSLCRILGYSRDEMMGMGNQQYTDQENRIKLYQAFNKVYKTGEPIKGFNWELIKKGGEKIFGEVSVSLMKDAKGQPIGFRGIARDISERKQTEEALQTEKQRFQTLSEQAPFGMVMIDQNGTFKYINPKFRELFGYDLTDVPDGKTWFRKAYPNPTYRHHIISIWKNDLECHSPGEKRSREYTVNCKDGTEKTVNFISVQLGEGENLITCEDITDRKRAEEALHLSEYRYRTTIDSMGDAIQVVNNELQIILANKYLQQWNEELGLETEVMGKTIFEVFPFLTDKVREEYQSVFENGKVLITEEQNIVGSRKIITETRKIPIFEGNKVHRVVTVIRDITERKFAEEALRASEEAARQLSLENATVADIGRIISSTLDIGEVYDRFADEVRRLIPFDRIAVNIIDHHEKMVFIPYVFGVDVIDSRFGGEYPLPGSFTEEVMQARHGLIVQTQDLEEITLKYPTLLTTFRAGLRSIMSVPLFSKDDVIGVLHFRSIKADAYTDKDLRLAERVANQISGAITNVQLFTEHERSEEALRKSEAEAHRLAEENELVAEIGRIIGSTLNTEEVYERFGEEAAKLIPFDRIAINLAYLEKGYTTIAYNRGVDVPQRKVGEAVSLAGTFTEEVLRTRKGQIVQGDEKEIANRFPGLIFSIRTGLRSMMSVPLFSKDEVIGVLNFRSLKANAYSERDLQLAERIGNQIAGAIANARLYKEQIEAREQMGNLQEQLRQSQKMEAIGQLAGGIAHDFNNLLTVIKGYSQLSLLDIKENIPLKENIEEIQKASERASNLTRQLLAFSRRQILDFKVVNLNTIIQDLDKMLHRILGEDIDLKYILAEKIGKVKIDPGQIEQVIMNLAVNARDAMPSGGRLVIETSDEELDEAYAHTHVGTTPGQYIRLTVSDTGFGMSPEVRDRVFEPFFSTKEKGKGTGLGLSTVYGIVKQSGGNIWVYSEPGKGTTFKIYFPRVDGPLEESISERDDQGIPRGNETILVVEDEEKVRELTLRILKKQGYRVLEARDGNEALSLLKERGESIDLVLTDMVMPGMSGRQLVDQLKTMNQELKMLYMSGYSENAITYDGVLEEGTPYIQKPFTFEKLARKVRQVLDD